MTSAAERLLVTGSLRLAHATIGMPLEFERCAFDEGSWLSLYSARITEVDLSGTTLSRPGDIALRGDLLLVEAAVYLHDLRVEGQVLLPGARIGGYLRLDGTSLSHALGPALLGQGLRVETGLYAQRGYKEAHEPFSVTGQVLLDGAQVSGGVHLDDARLDNRGGVALSADQRNCCWMVWFTRT